MTETTVLETLLLIRLPSSRVSSWRPGVPARDMSVTDRSVPKRARCDVFPPRLSLLYITGLQATITGKENGHRMKELLNSNLMNQAGIKLSKTADL